MKAGWSVAFALMSGAALGQPPSFVERPTYAYEVIDAIPLRVSLDADRTEISHFLADKTSAMTEFAKNVSGACQAFLSGDLELQDFAAKLDAAVKDRDDKISYAYEDMSARLSASARSALLYVVSQADPKSKSLVAVNMAEAAPAEAEWTFKILCNKVGVAPKL